MLATKASCTIEADTLRDRFGELVEFVLKIFSGVLPEHKSQIVQQAC